MKTPFVVRLQQLIPQRALCRFIYWVSRCEWRWFKSALIWWFAKQFRIDLSEAAEPSLSAYPSFNAFFGRALRPGARPIDPNPNRILSPADGRLTEFGSVKNDTMLQAKGVTYSPGDLLGKGIATELTASGARYATIYLAPDNYHRVHMPCDGRLKKLNYIAGSRFSVNQTTATHIPRLFCRNERLVCWFESSFGSFAMVLVGALNVSSISTCVTGEIDSGTDQQWSQFKTTDFKRGDEFGSFNLGSTVILLFAPNATTWTDSLSDQQTVRVGGGLGDIQTDLV